MTINNTDDRKPLMIFLPNDRCIELARASLPQLLDSIALTVEQGDRETAVALLRLIATTLIEDRSFPLG